MKKNILKSVALTALLVAGSIAHAQISYNSLNCQASGLYSSAVGDSCISKGDYSFAGGWYSRTESNARSAFSYGQNCIASGNHSWALGYCVTAQGGGSTAIGTYLTVSDGSVAIGRGYDNTDRMVVDRTRVIALGFDSNLPTMTVFSAPGKNRTGKVAIGNVTGIEPSAKLHIKADKHNGFGEDADILLQSQAGFEAAVCFQNKNNRISVATDSNAMNFTAGGFSFTTGNAMSFSASSYSFTTGKVGIGCENTAEGYALAVEGGILTDDVLIRSQQQWPDYVFGKDYNLMSLPELKRYISENRHLPDMPSETEVAGDGVSVGEMQALLLRKVEELTLYTIQQQEMIERLREQCEHQQKMIDELIGK